MGLDIVQCTVLKCFILLYYEGCFFLSVCSSLFHELKRNIETPRYIIRRHNYKILHS